MDASPAPAELRGLVVQSGAIDALRIQTAALVAQQAALFDRELRVQEREAALGRQEEQLADHLEDKRRQLLDLQDQITDAREKLRQKRAILDDLAERQARSLAAARDEAANLLGQAKADRQRMANLQRRLKERWRRERQSERTTFAVAKADLAAEHARLKADHDRFVDEVIRQTGRIELDKRRLKDGWARLGAERKEWHDRRAVEMADLHRRLRDLARRDKAVSAAEAQHKAAQAQYQKDINDRRHEIEYLETRIGHARQRLLEAQAGVIEARPVVALAIPAPPPDVVLPAITSASDARLPALTEVAFELADQRLSLSEQTARLEQARRDWLAQRDAAVAELHALTAALHDKEQSLIRRAREISIAEQRSHAEFDALSQRRLRSEAEHTRREAVLAERHGELERGLSELAARGRWLTRRELQLNDMLRLWGRRRRTAIEQLAQASQACLAERDEWAAARDAWLHEYEQVVAERRDLAKRLLALEQSREEWLDPGKRSPLARKRLERLERHWVSQFDADVRELERLRETLSAEAVRLDESAERGRRDRLAAAEQLAAADKQLAMVEADQAALAADRLRVAESADAEHQLRIVAEARVEGLRNEVEGLARLLIDAPMPMERAA